MSFLGNGRDIYRTAKQVEKDAGGFDRELPQREKYKQPAWYDTDMLPPPLRHPTANNNANGFITHEFVDAITHGRRPAIDIYEALAYTVPGIVAHQSAMAKGELKKVPQFNRPV